MYEYSFAKLMFAFCSEIKLLMLGIDNAGKSTIINDLKGGMLCQIFVFETVMYIDICDLHVILENHGHM